MSATVTAFWPDTSSQAVATGSGGHSVVMDAPLQRDQWQGMRPSELLLAALLGCTGISFAGIVRKQRQHVTSIQARATGEQDRHPPWAFRHIDVLFTVKGPHLNQAALERALNLAAERYCPVAATLRGGARITHRVEVVDSADPGA